MMLDEKAHFYVCGDCKMAEEVQQKLRQIMKKHANLNDEEVENVVLEMMVSETLGLNTQRNIWDKSNNLRQTTN